MPWGWTRGTGVPFGIEVDTVTGNDKRLIELVRSIDRFVISRY